MYNHNRSFDHEPHHALTSKDNHYFDVSKKYTPKRFLGLLVMIAIGIFGILLATQTVSPTSTALGNYTISISQQAATNSTLKFNYSISGLPTTAAQGVKKYHIQHAIGENGGCPSQYKSSGWKTYRSSYHDLSPTFNTEFGHQAVSGRMIVPVSKSEKEYNTATLCLKIGHSTGATVTVPGHTSKMKKLEYTVGRRNVDIKIDSLIIDGRPTISDGVLTAAGAAGEPVAWFSGLVSDTKSCETQLIRSTTYKRTERLIRNISILYNNKYICFKVKDRKGNTDFVTHKITGLNSQAQPRDTTAPIITTTVVSMTNSRIEVGATSDEPVHWYKGITSSDGICRAKTVPTTGAPPHGLPRTLTKTYIYSGIISPNLNGQYVCFKARDAAGNTSIATRIISGLGSQTQRSTPISITLTKLNSNNSSQLRFAYTIYNYPQGVNTNNIKQLLLHKIVSGNNCDNNVAWLQHDSNGVSHVSGPIYDNTRVHSGDEQSRVRGTIIMPITNTQRGYASAYLCFKVSLIIGSVDKSLSITLDPLPRDNPDDGSQPQQRDPDDEEQRPVATVGITVRQTPNANGLQFNYTITGLQHDRNIGMNNIKYHVAGANQEASSTASVCGNSWKAMNTASQFHMSDEDNRKAGHTIVSLTNSNGQIEAYYNQYRHYYACIRVNHPGTNNLLGNEYTLGSHPVDIKKPVLHSKADLSSYGNPGLVKVKMSANDDVDWVTGVVSNASDCAAKTIAITSDTPPRNANQPHTFSQQFTSNLINKYVCFKVQDHWGNSNYDASHRILDLSSPTPQDYPVVTVTQGGNGQRVFTATANEPITAWQHVVLDLNEICSENGLNGKTLNSGSTFTVSDNQIASYNKKQICFQATDSDDGLNGYNRLKIDLNPTVAIKHNGQFVYQAYVTDEPVDDNHWRHRVLNSATCNAQSFNNSQLGAVSLVKTGSLFVVAANKRDDYHNQYICFEIKDNDNLKGYKSMQMDLPEITDGHTPIIHITQAENVFKAYLSPDQSADWQYVVLDNSSACQASGFGNTAQTGSSLTVSEQLQLTYHGQVLCFQATLSDGQKVYGFMLMNFAGLSQPVIKVTRTEMTFVAHISPNMSADWRYLILDNNQCDSDIFTAKAQLVQTGNSVTVAAENKAEYHNKKYLCFKAALEDGRILYKSVLMDFESDTGSSGGEPPETVINTGILDDYQFSRLFGFVLITAAILGTTRIMLVKKYKRIY